MDLSRLSLMYNEASVEPIEFLVSYEVIAFKYSTKRYMYNLQHLMLNGVASGSNTILRKCCLKFVFEKENCSNVPENVITCQPRLILKDGNTA